MKLLRRHPGKPKTRRLLLCAALLVPALARAAGPPNLLRAEDFRHYVDALNQNDAEDVNGGIPNAEAWAWMTRNIPFLSCPDSHLELTYRSEEHTSELQSLRHLVCRLLLEKKNE